MLEFELGALLILIGMIALAIWLPTVTTGRKASVAMGTLLAIVVISGLARDTFGIGLVDILRVVLVIALLVAPFAVLLLVDDSRARGNTRRQ